MQLRFVIVGGMKMKKAICLFLGIFIMFSSFIPAFANGEDTEMSAVLQAIKPRIPDTEAYDKFTANIMLNEKN